MSSNRQMPFDQVPSFSNAVNHLVQSIAIEEESLAKLMRTEADKTSSFVGKELDFPSAPNTQEILTYNQSVIQFMDSMVMTQWLMLKKLHAISQMHVLHTGESMIKGEKNSKKTLELDWDYENFVY